MRAILLTVLMMTVAAFGQDMSFVEVGQTYFIAGDRNVTDILSEQNLIAEVDAIAGDWIRVYVEEGGVYAWINTNQLSLLVEVEDPDVTRIKTCLLEVSTTQVVYHIDFGVYTGLETLFEALGRPESCEGIELEAVEISEESYLIVGSLGDLSYQVSRDEGVEPTR